MGPSQFHRVSLSFIGFSRSDVRLSALVRLSRSLQLTLFSQTLFSVRSSFGSRRHRFEDWPVREPIYFSIERPARDYFPRRIFFQHGSRFRFFYTHLSTGARLLFINLSVHGIYLHASVADETRGIDLSSLFSILSCPVSFVSF